MARRPRHMLGAVVVLVLLLGPGAPGRGQGPRPGEGERCPVCGMFVAKYPDWVASITFRDGAVVYFDGVKDLLKFYFDLGRYAPGRSLADLREIHVTDYYNARAVPAQEAFFVVGGDVFGPMGKEVIPFDSEAAAREFLRDHHGIRVMRFDELRPTLLERLR